MLERHHGFPAVAEPATLSICSITWSPDHARHTHALMLRMYHEAGKVREKAKGTQASLSLMESSARLITFPPRM